jgi:hypothetical protein
MKKLGKKARHEFYKLLLEYYMNHINFKYLCPQIKHVCKLHYGCNNDDVKGDKILKLFPEFVAFKPKDSDFNDVWFENHHNSMTRIDAIKSMIEQTAPKPHIKKVI